jgi:hypothetical protein
MTAFLLALMTSGTIDAAAAAAGIGSATARRWYRQDAVQAEFRRMQSEIAGHTLRQLKTSMGEALAVLREVMSNECNPPSARVAAARAVLDNAFRAIETVDVLERLEALEARMGEAGG